MVEQFGIGFCPASEGVSPPNDLRSLDICAGELAEEEAEGGASGYVPEGQNSDPTQAQEEVIGEESAPIVKIKSPMMPTKAEIEEHESFLLTVSKKKAKAKWEKDDSRPEEESDEEGHYYEKKAETKTNQGRALFRFDVKTPMCFSCDHRASFSWCS